MKKQQVYRLRMCIQYCVSRPCLSISENKWSTDAVSGIISIQCRENQFHPNVKNIVTGQGEHSYALDLNLGKYQMWLLNQRVKSVLMRRDNGNNFSSE